MVNESTLPGSFYTLNTQWLFESDNHWGIPSVPPVPLSVVPDWVAPYRTRIRTEDYIGKGAVHFFLEDYRFESVWNQPVTALRSLEGWQVVLSPDFSLYRNYPLSLQLLNTYRNRWCQAFWSYHGHTVIPVVSWSTAASFPFAFLGLPRRSVVAVGTVGIDWKNAREYGAFEEGWEAMQALLEPSKVLVYGAMPEALAEQVEMQAYPTRWQGVAALRRKHGRKRE